MKLIRHRAGEILGPSALIASERLLRIGASAATGIVIARVFGPDDLGRLSAALSVVGLLVPLSLFGLDGALAAYLTGSASDANVLDRARKIAAAGAVTAASLAVLSALIIPRDGVPLNLVLPLLPILLSSPWHILRYWLERRHDFTAIALILGTTGLLTALAKVFVAVQYRSLTLVAAISGLEYLGIALGFALRRKSISHEASERMPSNRARDLRPSALVPILVAALATSGYMRIDQVMLATLSSPAEVGHYAAAARLSEVWIFVPVSVMSVLRARWLDATPSTYDLGTTLATRGLGALGLAGASALLIAASPVTLTVYGEQFRGSVQVLQIHAFGSAAIFAGVAGHYWLIDHGHQRFLAKKAILGLSMNVLLNVLLIPRHGATGAALSTLATYWYVNVVGNAFTRGRTRRLWQLQLQAVNLRSTT